jgi:hypothetical protein
MTSFDRFTLARSLGPLALLRLRAEVLLEHASRDRVDVTAGELGVLERIAVAPTPDDREFLGTFDDRLPD